jgi:hypothetical protein
LSGCNTFVFAQRYVNTMLEIGAVIALRRVIYENNT